MADAEGSDISQDYSDLSSEYSYSSNDEADLGLAEASTAKERPPYRIIDADLLKKVQVRSCCWQQADSNACSARSYTTVQAAAALSSTGSCCAALGYDVHYGAHQTTAHHFYAASEDVAVRMYAGPAG
jgi:hypothetical protein